MQKRARKDCNSFASLVRFDLRRIVRHDRRDGVRCVRCVCRPPFDRHDHRSPAIERRIECGGGAPHRGSRCAAKHPASAVFARRPHARRRLRPAVRSSHSRSTPLAPRSTARDSCRKSSMRTSPIRAAYTTDPAEAQAMLAQQLSGRAESSSSIATTLSPARRATIRWPVRPQSGLRAGRPAGRARSARCRAAPTLFACSRRCRSIRPRRSPAIWRPMPAIEYAEPDLLKQPMLVPNDPLYASQWHYHEPARRNGRRQSCRRHGTSRPGAPASSSP